VYFTDGASVNTAREEPATFQVRMENATGTVGPSDTPLPNTVASQPLNQILYGPPGTGKTFSTVDAALAILDPVYLLQHSSVRALLKARFDALVLERRVRFVTFHQSFSYEDFVEGIRATTSEEAVEGGSALRYTVERGIFADLCAEAKRDRFIETKLGVRDDATIWKLSISEASSKDTTRQYCLSHGEARIGWDHVKDIRRANLSDPALGLGPKDQQSLRYFANDVQVGDVVLCLGSKTTVRAVGVVTGDYEYDPQVPSGVRADYVHRRLVRWLSTNLDFDITALNGGKQLTQPTIYPLHRIDWATLEPALRSVGALEQIAGEDARRAVRQPYVLIIDEINRGNISRVFGELITLIEPSKRAGAAEALEVVLPYSKKPFSVPENVYLIGTMNTADRSLTAMDVALRRRFVFKPMPPRPRELRGIAVDKLDIERLLTVMNQRIEVLLDRDHCLGHAYFMRLRDTGTLAILAEIFRNQVLPLLQEYFFDDWQRIQWVLNDHRKPKAFQFLQSGDASVADLFGDGVNVTRTPRTWSLNDDAFGFLESYLGIIDHEDSVDAT
jgi:5-methylcytosine-specific restriction protein B